MTTETGHPVVVASAAEPRATSLPATSLIVVSRHRQAALMRAICGIRQMDHPAFELIVVADPAACLAVRALALPIKIAVCDEANISAARNLGLMLAAGAVVAFLDDDAVPEPTWLSRLTAPFADPRVAAAGGFVRGRNGISHQWRACEVDALGRDHPLSVDATQVTIRSGTGQRAVKTQGTNCAFRRADLLAIGGFDPALRFYLDEAHVNLMLAARGELTAIVPLAEVHHGYAASARRRADRVPLSLHEIGASSMVFLRRHAPGGEWPVALAALRAEQRARALRHMVGGHIEPRQVAQLLATLEDGIAEGRTRQLADHRPLDADPPPLLLLPATGPRPGRMIAGRRHQKAALLAAARDAVGRGEIVTVLCLSRSARAHRHSFATEGYWLQEGGLFGRSDRRQPALRLAGWRARVAEETRRLEPFRPVGRSLSDSGPDQPASGADNADERRK